MSSVSAHCLNVACCNQHVLPAQFATCLSWAASGNESRYGATANSVHIRMRLLVNDMHGKC